MQLNNFFGKPPANAPFILFGKAHLMALVALPLISFLIYYTKDQIRTHDNERTIRYTAGIFIIFVQISYGLNNMYNGIATIKKDLPLSLCGAAMVLTGVLLLTKSYRLFEVLYFWSIVGVIQALITPNLGPYGPTHFRFYQFMIGHIGVFVLTIYMIVVHGFRPRYRSIYKSLGWLIVFTFAVLLFNYWTGANYLYLLKPPANPSLLDYFPEFPMNVLVLIGIAFALFHLAYLPFYFKKQSTNTATSIHDQIN